MSVKKLHTEFNTFYYYTFTCFQWWSLFEIVNLYYFIYQWFEILVKRNVYNCGFVIMPNHMHGLVYTSNSQQTINKIIGTGKRFMAYEIIDRLETLGRRDLLKVMSDAVTPFDKDRNKKHEVFEDSFDCKEIITEKFIRQKLNYMHKNPVSGKWKLVDNYLDYEHSSARFYDLGEKPDCVLFHYLKILSDESSPQAKNKFEM